MKKSRLKWTPLIPSRATPNGEVSFTVAPLSTRVKVIRQRENRSCRVLYGAKEIIRPGIKYEICLSIRA